MNHADVLKLLFPLPIALGGVYEDDALLEGLQLDRTQESAERLLAEAYPDGAHRLLASWERVCGLTPAADDPLQARRAAVIRKLRAVGGLSRVYFIALASAYGWVITIDELRPFMCGWDRCGDTLYEESVRWIWRVNAPSQSVYSFRAGVSASGERLRWWVPNTVLETMFETLKPAHTYVVFNYD
jgi:uncharacterized protein YmfQ (DUF2313 family)